MATNLAVATRPQLYRFYYIDGMIKNGRYPNSRGLAEALGVSRRTILRDVEFMRDSLNAPLEYCPKNRGYYYTEAEYSLGLLKFAEGELLALYLAHNLLTQCEGTPFKQPVISAFNKICCHLQENVNIDFDELSDYLSFDFEPLRGEEKAVAAYFTSIGEAIKKQRTIKLKHYSITRDTCQERLVDPYQMRYYQGAWYLVGYCHFRKAMRIFALDRIQALQITKNKFSMVAEFDPDKYFTDAFQMFKGPNIHQVKIWFSPDQARWIKEKRWHPTQEITENMDGSLVLSMSTSGLFQVKRWVLSFGAEAKSTCPRRTCLCSCS